MGTFTFSSFSFFIVILIGSLSRSPYPYARRPMQSAAASSLRVLLEASFVRFAFSFVKVVYSVFLIMDGSF